MQWIDIHVHCFCSNVHPLYITQKPENLHPSIFAIRPDIPPLNLLLPFQFSSNVHVIGIDSFLNIRGH